MVFESIVTELLNKILGEYIENLDTSQLKLSLWGGDVVLRDLLIKEGAVDTLKLPVKLQYGQLGKLVLKIPFKDIWNGQIDAIVEELFILLVPTSQVQYDSEKEEKAALETKKAELARIEKNNKLTDRNSPEKVDDSMVEKLIARMIKNIHVEINRIHVRYEDHVTFTNYPFSVGFSLNRFALESCDNSWSTIGNLKEMYSIQQIFKLCTMDGFAIYLNPSAKQFSTDGQTMYCQAFSESIATADFVPANYSYLLGPINVKAKLKLNPKPENDGTNYTLPKIFLDLEMQKLRIALSRRQFHTLVQMSEGLELARSAAPYRKYRPNLTSYSEHYKEWWIFAYTCILEEHVKRARRNWNWNHMKCHRDTCRNYASIYHKKITIKKLPTQLEKQLAELEKQLDIFNLIIIRQQIEMEVEKLAKKDKALKTQKSWFGFLWRTSTQQVEVEGMNTAAAIMRKFEEAMTTQEKEKLYKAIDYQENSAPTHYPETYEEIHAMFLLHCLQVLLLDTDKEYPQILNFQLNEVKAVFKSRPSAKSISVTTSITDLELIGLQQNNYIPSLIKSEFNVSSNSALFFVSYESNPIDKLCGDRVIIKTNTAHIVYDAQTIIEVIKLFRVQNESSLHQLQAVAAQRLDSLKEVSALGLEYAIQNHSVFDVQVDLKASQIIMPHGGSYNNGNGPLLVINLGSFSMHSLEKASSGDINLSVKQLVNMGKSEKDILSHLREYSYDKFILKIVNFQILISKSNEDWRNALNSSTSPMKMIQPMSLEIQFHKCLIADDILLPNARLIGHLPSILIDIEETRLLEALAIVQSIPLPENEEKPNIHQTSGSKSLSQLSLHKEFPNISSIVQKKESMLQTVKQTTDLEAKFIMKELMLTIWNKKNGEANISTFIKVELLQLEVELIKRTFNQEIMLRLGGIQVKQHHDGGEIFIINTPIPSQTEEYLIIVHFLNTSKLSPNFIKQGSVLNILQLKFTTLDILLHQEGLINVLHFLSNIQNNIKVATTSARENQIKQKAYTTTHLAAIQEDTAIFLKEHIQKQKKTHQDKPYLEFYDLKVTARIRTISLKLKSNCRDISAFYMEGLTSTYTVKVSHSQFNMKLTSINIKDLNKTSIYKNILSVDGSDSVQFEAIVNNIRPNDIDRIKMFININVGCHRIIFLNAFVTSVMNFLNNFQTAQAAIADASAAAAEVAKSNIKDVHDETIHIKLLVKLKAPVIYIPINSKSEHCLMLDMGNLTISNVLKKMALENDSDEYLTDEINVELLDLKLSRIRISKENFYTENEILLLQPVSFILQIKRNLSISKFRNIPDIEMLGELDHIILLLSKEDYVMIITTFNENINETYENCPVTLQEYNDIRSTIEDQNGKIDVEADVEFLSETSKSKAQEDYTQTTIKFKFIMNSLIIELFTGGSKLMKSQDSPLHLTENSFAKFGLTYLAVKGRLFDHGLLVTSITLMNFTLDDTRCNRKCSLVRIMERITYVPIFSNCNYEDTKSSRSMLDITIRKGLKDLLADIRIFSFSIIVSLDYLIKIKEFFNVDCQSPPQVTSYFSQKINYEEQIKKKTNRSTTLDIMLTVILHIEKPDFILIEDMDDIDSHCIILNTELFFKIIIMDEDRVITGSIKDLSILSGIYNPSRRSDYIYQVLRPTSVSIAGSTPEGNGLHLNICSTDIHISVSPSVIEILSRVLQKIIPKISEDTEDNKFDSDNEGLWSIKSFNDSDYWFLQTEIATEACEDIQYSDEVETIKFYKPELAVISISTILLTLESGIGNKTLPMLFLRLSFLSNIMNWNTETMRIDSTVSVIITYYNSTLALWEPLIEPIDAIENQKRISSPWELKIKLQINKPSINLSEKALNSILDTELEEVYQKSRVTIEISSSETLEITVTKTCLEVMKQLGSAFSNAMEVGNKSSIQKMASYVLRNETGLSITLDLQNSQFDLAGIDNYLENNRHSSYADIFLESGTSIKLTSKKKVEISILEQIKVNKVSDRCTKTFVIMFTGIERKLKIPILRADKRFFSLKYRRGSSDEWGIISDVVVENGSTIVTLRSILQIHNHFLKKISVYYMTDREHEVEKVGTVCHDEKLNLPLDAVYTSTNTYWLFFSVEGYMVSIEPFIWKNLQRTISMKKILKCEARSSIESNEPIYIQAIGDIEQVYFENTSRYTMASTTYSVHLYPTVYLKNSLPIDITVALFSKSEQVRVEASSILQIPTIYRSCIVIKLHQYLEKDWSCKVLILENAPEFSVLSFESFDSTQKINMELGLHTSYRHGSVMMALYCPFWLLNKTDLMLSYRNTEEHLHILYHHESFKEPILFSFGSKDFFGKKKAMIRIENGEWSEKFSIDVAGSKGVVACKCNGKLYRIGVNNQLTYNSLTKQIIFTPYFVLINNADFLIECQEADRLADPIIKVPAGECAALWPNSELEKKMLKAKIFGYPEKTSGFIYTDIHSTLLKLENKYGGINVDIQINEGGAYITFSAYFYGSAPALIINHTFHSINLWEKGSINVRIIESYNRMFYTWENPAGERLLIWEDGNKMQIADSLRKDNLGAFMRTNTEEIYYVSFLDGIQRVLLFTSNLKVAEDCQLVGSVEIFEQDISVNIHGIGLSLVNNTNRSELLYLSISSSGIIWERQKSECCRWRSLSNREVTLIEDEYQKYQRELHSDADTHCNIKLESKLEIDFLKMEILRPNRGRIRRTFQAGLWIQHRISAHQVQIHAKINRLQIDNQLPQCIFPVILAPVPPPKSVSQCSALQAFAEMSMVKRLLVHSNVQQFQYFKVLIQEFHIKVDLTFMNALMILCEADEINEAQESNLFKNDMRLVNEPLLHHVNLITTSEQKNFFDLLHFSPLKIHVSFSITGRGGGPSAMPHVLNVLMQSIGVTLTDINDIVFKLAYFERDYVFMTYKQLISEATSHYTGQAIKQLYVLVLGLDVIGNPYGLVVGAMKGVEDLFYEPFQGAIQGPDEFAEGLLLGVRSMLGHTVGGMAGAVSKITGAMGKGLAALTFDKDFQRKRQDQLSKQPENLQEGLARSGKGLVMGVVDGITGVVTKPYSGAREEGVEGFLKGFGKGVVGLVTRPTAGIIDFASGSFGAVRSLVLVSREGLDTPPVAEKEREIKNFIFQRSIFFSRNFNGAYVKGSEFLAYFIQKSPNSLQYKFTLPYGKLTEKFQVGFWKTFTEPCNVSLLEVSVASGRAYGKHSLEACLKLVLGSLHAIATDLSDEVKRVRPPRFLQPDGFVRPYIREDAEGNKILSELEKGKFANTDIFYFYTYINKDVILLTDKRIAYLEKCDLFGGWKMVWSYAWQDIDLPLVMTDKGIQICIKDNYRRKKFGGFFSNSEMIKIILTSDLQIKQLLYEKIQQQLTQ